MAKMIPDVNPNEIENGGELVVYREFRDQLPNSWTVRFHYPYCVKDGPYLRDGEVDFIIVAPGQGVLFVEVKGSYGYDVDDNGQWRRIDKYGKSEKSRNPFEQVTGHKHRIVESILCKRLGLEKKDFPGIYGHLVIYPKAKVVGTIPASQDPQVLLAYEDMQNLLAKLLETFGLWGNAQRAASFTTAKAKSIVEILRDKGAFVAVAAADMDEDELEIERLTRRQYETYTGLLANRRAIIEGQAGTGKTMLALWTARELARRGKTLFVCYNKSLAEYLNAVHDKVPDLHITNFHSLCASFANKAKLPWQPPEGKDADFFWRETASTVLDEAIDRLQFDEKYSALVVDEGQDFYPNWWIPIELLLRNDKEGYFYIFHDPFQAIQMSGEPGYPDIATHFQLSVNCRNTQKIAKYCGNVIEKLSISMDGIPEGVKPQVLDPCESPADRADQCIELIKKWRLDGVNPRRIAVLSPWRSGKSSSLEQLSNRQVNGVGFEADPEYISKWVNDDAIWLSTIKRFKGLEADCLIVTDIPSDVSQWFSVNDLYVAVSRGKHHVVLIPEDAAAKSLVQKYL